MLKKFTFCFFLLFFGIQALAAQEYYSNHLLVSLNSGASAWPTGPAAKIRSKVSGELNRLFETYHVVKVERWLKSADERDVFNGVDFTKIYRLHLQKSSLLKEARRAFASLAEVRLAEEEPVIKIAAPIPPTVPNDPYFDRQWYLKRIMADYAWSLKSKMPQDAPPVLIGIVDTGIDYLHPEIGPVLYVNPGEDIDGDGQVTDSDYNGVDDDGNGFVDDILGWDFSMASDSTNGDNDIRPPAAGSNEILSHGTHVSGIAGAIPDNDVGISGIARNYRIIGTKQSRDDDYKHGYLYNAYDGVLYAAKLGADVINCSWGGSGFSQEAQDLINLVTQKYGAIVVAAAGNDNNNNDHKHFYPSDLDNVITVAALDPTDHKAWFSNYGHVIDISAPGQSIFSTIHYYKGGYASWAGTSMASPVVAGSFALLKAFFPELPNDSLINRLLQAADPLGTDLLGSGRVNVYNAIAPQYLPGLHMLGDSLSLQDENGNGQIDPEETIHWTLSLENKAHWQDAHQVKITARCSDSLVTLVDSVAFLGDIPAGTKIKTQPLAFTAQINKKHAYGQFKVEFNITCNPDSALAFNEHYSVSVLLSTYQKGFPWTQNGTLLPMSLLHSQKENKNFIVFIAQDYGLYLIDDSGRVVDGFPVDLQEYHRVPPVFTDLDGDGEREIVTVSQRGKVNAFKTNGSLLWKTDIGQTVYGNVAAADLNGDRQPEIVIATMQKKLHVLNAQGNEKDGFPIDVGSLVDRGVALADVNNDSLPEIVFGTFDHRLHCLNGEGRELPGWPVELPLRVKFTPVIAEDANGIHIFVTDRNGRVRVLGPDGSTQADTLLTSSISKQPALGDFNGDGLADLVAPCEDGNVRAVSADGTVWFVAAKRADTPFDISPLLVSNGSGQRIFLASSAGMVDVLNEHARSMSFAPIYLTRTLASAPVLGDLDNDGDLEFISADSKALIVLDLPDSLPSFSGWVTAMGNDCRTGFVKIASATKIAGRKDPILPTKLILNISPNPFNATTQIKLKLPGNAIGKNMRITVYNINGQKIKSIFNGLVTKQSYRWLWHGRNADGKVVSSGLYFVTIKLANNLFGKQILFVK